MPDDRPDRSTAMPPASKLQPSVSAVILNWNTRDYVRACLRSLERTALGELQRTIVVDNASSDGSADMVADEFPHVWLVRSPQNLFYAAGNNLGAAEATGEYLLILNPDTEVLGDGVAQLRGFLDEHPEASAVAPRLVHPDGSAQSSIRLFPTPLNVLLEVSGLSRLAPRSRVLGAYRMGWWDQSDVREVEQPMTSCLMVRRTTWEALDGMDEGFPMFFNDVDLCYRLKQSGGSIWFLPSARVLHHVGASTRQVKREMIVASHRGLERFYRKHYLGRVPYWLYLVVMAVSRAACLARLLRQRFVAG